MYVVAKMVRRDICDKTAFICSLGAEQGSLVRNGWVHLEYGDRGKFCQWEPAGLCPHNHNSNMDASFDQTRRTCAFTACHTVVAGWQ